MRRALVPAAVALLFSALCVGAWAQDLFKLTYQEATNPEDPVLGCSLRYTGPAPANAPKLRGAPRSRAKTERFFINLGERAVQFVLVRTEPPRLYADTNGDGDLADERAVVGVRLQTTGRGPRYGLGPIVLQGRGTASPGVRLRVIVYEAYVGLLAAGYWTGEVQLDGARRRVAVVDGDLDGVYRRSFSPEQPSALHRPGDHIAIDLDRDGRFQADLGGELQPIAKMLAIGGSYYDVEVAPDGSALRLEKVTPPLGALAVGNPGAGLLVYSDACILNLAPNPEGRWQLPAGKYVTEQINLTRRDAAGATWLLNGISPSAGNLANLEIRAGQMFAAKVGEPIITRALVTPTANKGELTVGFEAIGQAGERYAPGLMKNGVQQPAPGLKVLDDAGRALLAAKFEYG